MIYTHTHNITFTSDAKHPHWYRTECTPWLDDWRKPLTASLNCGFSTNLKWIQTPHTFKLESKSKFKPLQGYLAWGSAPAQLGLVRLASTNSGCFLVGCNSCGQLQASLRKKCYHSGNTDLVWESNMLQWFSILGHDNIDKWLTTFFFKCQFFVRWKFDGFCKNLLQTKAVPIAWASLNLAIIHCLWKNILHRTKSACPELSPVQTLQSSRSKSMTCTRNLLRFSSWIEQHSNFRWLHTKAWKRISGIMLNQWWPILQPKQ